MTSYLKAATAPDLDDPPPTTKPAPTPVFMTIGTQTQVGKYSIPDLGMTLGRSANPSVQTVDEQFDTYCKERPYPDESVDIVRWWEVCVFYSVLLIHVI
jgi:hypothetical protein